MSLPIEPLSIAYIVMSFPCLECLLNQKIKTKLVSTPGIHKDGVRDQCNLKVNQTLIDQAVNGTATKA